MSKKQFVKRYLLIINKLRKKACSFGEIQDHLQQQSELDEESYEISIRTFQRDIKEIGSIYNIEISYNRSQNAYEIIQDANEDRSERLMESFEIFNVLNLSSSFQNHVIVEKRKPMGTENMNGLLHAIKNNFEITFTHEKHWEDEFKKSRTVYPLSLKEARNRWYLVAKDPKDNVVKTFGLDRISALQITNIKFIYPLDYQHDEKFKYSFGIITNEVKPEIVKIALSQEQANYIKTLPLHYSQKIISESEKECVIELHLSPTYDFVMELLSMGSEVKVLEPKSLQEEIKMKLSQALNLYN
jgi:predicted DNA-binding transcriptional regulator YafY